MLKSLDVFAGIGGITHGLRDVAVPVMYCELDEYCVSVLDHLMLTAAIPSAFIHRDIRTLVSVPEDIDIIVAGIPCTGFSTAGKRRGLDDVQSGLYSHVLRLVQNVKPPYVFFENVAAIRSGGMRIILRDLEDEGYTCRWMTLYARDVGAPHRRNRWFMLASKSGRPPHAPPATPRVVTPPARDWTSEPVDIPRMGPFTNTTRKSLGALGNAAVPDQVRAAYMWLCMNWDDANEHNETKKFPERTDVDLGIVLRPMNVFREERHQREERHRRTIPVDEDIHIRMWGTPRKSAINSNVVLTVRGAKDLATQVRFDIRTPPGDTIYRHPNPRWVEWLMGFPRGWLGLNDVARNEE